MKPFHEILDDKDGVYTIITKRDFKGLEFEYDGHIYKPHWTNCDNPDCIPANLIQYIDSKDYTGYQILHYTKEPILYKPVEDP